MNKEKIVEYLKKATAHDDMSCVNFNVLNTLLDDMPDGGGTSGGSGSGLGGTVQIAEDPELVEMIQNGDIVIFAFDLKTQSVIQILDNEVYDCVALVITGGGGTGLTIQGQGRLLMGQITNYYYQSLTESGEEPVRIENIALPQIYIPAGSNVLITHIYGEE